MNEMGECQKGCCTRSVHPILVAGFLSISLVTCTRGEGIQIQWDGLMGFSNKSLVTRSVNSALEPEMGWGSLPRMSSMS